MSETQKYLCIGGPLDGQFVALSDDRQDFLYPVMRNDPNWANQTPVMWTFESVHYRVYHFQTGQSCALLSSLAFCTVIDRLLANYVPPVELERRDSATVMGLKLRIEKLCQELAIARQNNQRFDAAREKINRMLDGMTPEQYHGEKHNTPGDTP